MNLSSVSLKRTMLAVLASLATANSLWSADLPAHPNIVYIMADDLGYTDVACFGSKYYQTPNIDRLASQGMKLTNFHQCQNCAPSRAALMTGQYSPRTGVYTVGNIDRFDSSMRPLAPVENVTELPLDRVILPQQLKSSGYATGIFGKWHLGNQARYSPSQRGFDEAIISSGAHFEFKTAPEIEHPKEEYLADFLTDKAVDFIQRHQSGPFFLYLPHFGVHAPLQAKEELIERFRNLPAAGGHHNPTYAAMIASVDESVGRVLKTLDDLRLTEKTIVVFTTDNGGVGGYQREGLTNAKDTTDNAPLRSGKGSLYEGGTRVPFIVRWPGVVPAGTSNDTPAINVDIYPSLMEVSGTSAPSQTLDGVSLAGIWRNPASQLNREAIYQHFPGYLGSGTNVWRTTPVSLIEQGEWKLMEFLEDGHLELYNLREDIGEEQNLASTNPEKAKELAAKLNTWRTSVNAKMPEKRDPADATAATAQKKKGKGKGKKIADPDAD